MDGGLLGLVLQAVGAPFVEFALAGGGCWLLVWVHGLHAKVDRLAVQGEHRWGRTEARVAALEASALRIEAYVRTVP